MSKYLLQKTYDIIYMPTINDVYSDFRGRIEESKMKMRVGEITRKIDELKMNRNIQGDECPICYEPISTTNYIIPKCGHKVCLPCYKKSIISNRQTANTCCLCRQQIL